MGSKKQGLFLILEKRWFYVLAGALVFLFSLLIYLPSFKAPFHFDDLESIINNPFIRVTRLTPSALYTAAFQDFKQNRPLSNLSFALNYYFNILNPAGYHSLNFSFHLVSGFCALLLLERIFYRRLKNLASARLIAIITALLFLAHPVNTQAVTYIVQRHSVMAGCFSLMALLFYDLGRSQRRVWLFALAGLAGLAAMLSKETALVLPILIFVYERWFWQEPGLSLKSLRSNWKWLLALLGGYILMLALLLRGAMAGKLSSDFSEFHFTAFQRTLTEPRALLWYLGLIAYPFAPALSIDHEFAVSTSLFHPFTTLPAILIIIALIGFALIRAKEYPLLSFGILWYFGQLAVEAGPLPIDLVNEHRLYVAAIPALAAVPYLLTLRIKNWKAGIALSLLAAVLLGAMTYERNLVWLTRVRLWRDAVLKSPHQARTWYNYCSFLIEAGETNRAGYACSYAVGIDPSRADTHTNLGLCLFQIGDLEAAQNQFLKAIELEPDYAIAYFNLGLVKGARQDLAAAKYYFEKALQLKPKDAKVYYNLGVIYEKFGEPVNALRFFSSALSLRPEWVEARLKIAAALAEQGRCEDAVQLIRESPLSDARFEEILNRCQAGR